MSNNFTIEEWNELLDLMAIGRAFCSETQKLRWAELQTRVCFADEFDERFRELLDRRWQIYEAFYVVLGLDP